MTCSVLEQSRFSCIDVVTNYDEPSPHVRGEAEGFAYFTSRGFVLDEDLFSSCNVARLTRAQWVLRLRWTFTHIVHSVLVPLSSLARTDNVIVE
jgi:hypothetical protein